MCPKSIFTVYGPISMRFGMNVAHRALITGKILRSSYLGNRNQKTSSDVIHQLKGNGCLKGRAMDGKKIVPMGFRGNQSVTMATKKPDFMDLCGER